MHNCFVIMKDGRKFCGPIWEFRPQAGYFTIVDNAAPDIIKFSECKSIITHVRTHPNVVEDIDVLERARKEGWDGT